jgi:hypothetical protein
VNILTTAERPAVVRSQTELDQGSAEGRAAYLVYCPDVDVRKIKPSPMVLRQWMNSCSPPATSL